MNELALFAGAGGGILGGVLLGWRTVCAVEFDSHAREVLLARQADGCLGRFPIWDDVTTFDGTMWAGKVDVITGGFPCQDISSAGKGVGITGSRSGLWKHMARIIHEVRPKYIFAENSPLLVGRGLTTVLCDLATMGFDARWCVLGADNCNADHIRKRCWVLAYPSKGGRPRGEAYEIDGCHSNSSRVQAKILQVGWNGKQKGFYWESEPRVGRVADGMAIGVDKRLARIGNGQVPAVARLAWQTLTRL
jgi:DNA (cytosine-5)-methyltransferase 1